MCLSYHITNLPNLSTFLCKRFNASTRSPRTVQQIQPFITSITSSSTFSGMILSSTPISPNSFSITANFIPCVPSLRMWLSKVVFPEPRKPVRTVTGILVAILRFVMVQYQYQYEWLWFDVWCGDVLQKIFQEFWSYVGGIYLFLCFMDLEFETESRGQTCAFANLWLRWGREPAYFHVYIGISYPYLRFDLLPSSKHITALDLRLVTFFFPFLIGSSFWWYVQEILSYGEE